jgi:hypothetical protein
MEWLEQLKANSPYVAMLGGGLVVVWRAYVAKDKALEAAKNETIALLAQIAKGSSKD